MKAGVCALVILAASATAAQAGSRPGDRVSEIVSQQAQIRADVKAEKNGWDNIAADKRQELISKQDQLMLLINGKQTLDDLAPADHATAVQTLEWIDALAAKADDERQVCTRERTTGTNRVTTVCRSAGAMKKRRERTIDAFRQGRGNLMPPKGTDI
ncbi:MAG TPA: hypothetical protein VM619_12490 [Luteimonas sp.]|nr:hypothetical protein [Luteimonas sp.]